MNDINDTDAPAFDDHEPGDVNGNVDPAWAKKQKAAAKQRTPRPADGKAPRPRSSRDRSGPAPDASPVLDGSSSAVQVLDGEPGARAVGSTATEAQGANSVAVRAPGERRPHGSRRPRRDAAPNPATAENSNFSDSRPMENGVTAENTDQRIDLENSRTPYFNGQSAIELNSVSDTDATNPNPGAFGDPNRPMDRSARRNRTRNRNREKSDRGRAIRDARIQADAAGAVADATALDASEDTHGERDGERLHKVLAQQGLGSRRAMESLIENGEVEVNGKPAQVGQVVNESDRVYVKRRKVSIKLGDDKPRIMIYHKPSGEIVTRDDPEARDTVFDRLPRPDHGKWIAIGRLDYNTEGLLLFTTSGELANRMMHPRYEIMREYSVRILGELTPEQEDELIDGIELDDGPARVLSLDRIDRDSEGANHWYRITINEGRNREVRRMFEHLGLTVSRLIRTRYGAVNMPSWLKRGQYKLLDENDTFNILEAVGMRSRKKLEKAARFGGARGKLPQQGPVGPMRSATEHEAVWNGAPASAAMPGARGDRRTGGRMQRGRNGAPRGDNFGSAMSLQQQQFPGFGGGATDPAALGNRRPRGNKVRRGGGEVNGNIDPNFRGNRGRGRVQRANVPLDFDENGNVITPPTVNQGNPRPGGQPNGPRGANNRRNGRGNGRARQPRPRDQASAAGDPNIVASADGALAAGGEPGQLNAANPRGSRNRRGARRGGGRGRSPRPPREAGAEGALAPAAPPVIAGDE